MPYVGAIAETPLARLRAIVLTVSSYLGCSEHLRQLQRLKPMQVSSCLACRSHTTSYLLVLVADALASEVSGTALAHLKDLMYCQPLPPPPGMCMRTMGDLASRAASREATTVDEEVTLIAGMAWIEVCGQRRLEHVVHRIHSRSLFGVSECWSCVHAYIPLSWACWKSALICCQYTKSDLHIRKHAFTSSPQMTPALQMVSFCSVQDMAYAGLETYLRLRTSDA
jgi:hypothetical protein